MSLHRRIRALPARPSQSLSTRSKIWSICISICWTYWTCTTSSLWECLWEGGWPSPEVAKLLFHDPSQAPSLATMTDEQVTRLAGDHISHAMYTWEPSMHNPKLRYRLHRINVPTLLLWGASDRMVP